MEDFLELINNGGSQNYNQGGLCVSGPVTGNNNINGVMGGNPVLMDNSTIFGNIPFLMGTQHMDGLFLPSCNSSITPSDSNSSTGSSVCADSSRFDNLPRFCFTDALREETDGISNDFGVNGGHHDSLETSDRSSSPPSVINEQCFCDITNNICHHVHTPENEGPEPEIEESEKEGDSASSAAPTPNNIRIHQRVKRGSNPLIASAEENPKKRYKSKDSEKNRRNRINERLDELKSLIPVQSLPNKRELTKEEILCEAIHYIHELHAKIYHKKTFSDMEQQQNQQHNLASPQPPINKAPSKPPKRARLLMAMFFAIGIILIVSPFRNPPQNHPLYEGERIPKHHSRVIVGANNTCESLFFYEPELLGISYPYSKISSIPLEYELKDKDEECSIDHNICKLPYECVNHRCVPVAIGDSCTDSDDCGYWMNCVKGHCTELHFAGESCHSNTECYSHNCHNSTCTGKNKRKHCNPSAPNQCGEGMYCSLSQKRCRPQLKLGDKGCLDTAEYSNYLSVCGDFSSCNTGTNKCTQLFSQEEGEKCGEVLNCKLSYDCIKGHCKKVLPVCDANKGCTISGSCQSNQTDSSCFYYNDGNDCNDEIESWKSCGKSSGCQVRHIFDWNGCMNQNCFGVQDKLERCLEEAPHKVPLGRR